MVVKTFLESIGDPGGLRSFLHAHFGTGRQKKTNKSSLKRHLSWVKLRGVDLTTVGNVGALARRLAAVKATDQAHDPHTRVLIHTHARVS